MTKIKQIQIGKDIHDLSIPDEERILADLGTLKNNHVASVNGRTGDVIVSKSSIGLGNVTDDAQVKRTEMGKKEGVATLDAEGHVPVSQLPSYVDDVIEGDSLSSFPQPGKPSKIYVAKDTGKTYRWGGTQYVVISETIAIGTNAGTAFEGNRGASLEGQMSVVQTKQGKHDTEINDTCTMPFRGFADIPESEISQESAIGDYFAIFNIKTRRFIFNSKGSHYASCIDWMKYNTSISGTAITNKLYVDERNGKDIYVFDGGLLVRASITEEQAMQINVGGLCPFDVIAVLDDQHIVEGVPPSSQWDVMYAINKNRFFFCSGGKAYTEAKGWENYNSQGGKAIPKFYVHNSGRIWGPRGDGTLGITVTINDIEGLSKVSMSVTGDTLDITIQDI